MARGRVLDPRALEAPLLVEGFDGFVVMGIVRSARHAELAASFPSGGFRAVRPPPQDADGYLGGRLATRPVGPDERLPPAWARLLDEARAAPYAAALGRVAGVDLAGAELRARFVRYPPDGGFLAAHYDHQRGKVLTQVLYGNASWREEWGGHFEMLAGPDAEAPLARVPPVVHCSVVNRSSPRAWHRVQRVAAGAAQDRLTLLLEWYRAGE